eukprot:5522253-Pleurochrysis_carterae.AAC.1
MSTTSPFRKSLTLALVSAGCLPATGGGVTGVGAATVGAELPPVPGVPCPAPTTRRRYGPCARASAHSLATRDSSPDSTVRSACCPSRRAC